jgi:HAD superfamily hydrolase (TIGR01509 family)
VTEIEVVLFDLGGVLMDFGGVDPMKALTGIETDDEMWRQWLTNEWVRTFERGGCTAPEFAAGLVDDWNLSLTAEAFLEEFETWPLSTNPGAEELVASVRAHVPTGCLSNTNAAHWGRSFGQVPLLDGFDFQFLSFEIGIVKPDRELFDRVAELLPVPASRVLFLDDNVLNVEGAREAGFVARHVKGVEEARAALVDAGVLP